MNKFTPGPWKAQKDLRHSSNTGIITNGPYNFGVYGDHFRVCTLEEFSTYLPQEIVEANARLIAAAPEILNALEKLLEHNSKMEDEAGYDHAYECPGIENCIVCQAEEAIKKARGE